MERALASKATPHVLGQRWAELKKHKRPISPDLQERYQKALGDHQRGEVRKVSWIAGSVAVATVALVLIFWIRAAQQRSEAELVAKISEAAALVKGDVPPAQLEQAERLYAALQQTESAATMRRHDVVLVKVRIDQLRKEEDDRVADLDQQFRSLENDPVPPAERAPATAKARKLAKRAEEKQKIDLLLSVRREKLKRDSAELYQEYERLHVKALGLMLLAENERDPIRGAQRNCATSTSVSAISGSARKTSAKTSRRRSTNLPNE